MNKNKMNKVHKTLKRYMTRSLLVVALGLCGIAKVYAADPVSTNETYHIGMNNSPSSAPIGQGMETTLSFGTPSFTNEAMTIPVVLKSGNTVITAAGSSFSFTYTNCTGNASGTVVQLTSVKDGTCTVKAKFNGSGTYSASNEISFTFTKQSHAATGSITVSLADANKEWNKSYNKFGVHPQFSVQGYVAAYDTYTYAGATHNVWGGADKGTATPETLYDPNSFSYKWSVVQGDAYIRVDENEGNLWTGVFDYHSPSPNEEKAVVKLTLYYLDKEVASATGNVTLTMPFYGLYKFRNKHNSKYYLAPSTNKNNEGNYYLKTDNNNTGDGAVWALYGENGVYQLVHFTDNRYVIASNINTETQKAVYLQSTNTPGDNSWFRISKNQNDNYYTIVPQGDTKNFGFNPWAGNGNDIGLYRTSDASSQWIMESVQSLKLSTPTITFNEEGYVTITTQQDGCTIYYTTDGTDPTTQSNVYTKEFQVSNGTTVKAFATKRYCENSDIASNRYAVQEFIEISSLSEVTDPDYNYRLIVDNPTGSISLEEYRGVFDGNFRTITGLTQALFKKLNNATVKNVILDNVKIPVGNDTYVGAIVNEASGKTRIYNCGVLATGSTYDAEGKQTSHGSTIFGNYVGSIVGRITEETRVLNCYSYAHVGGNTASGIVGVREGTAMGRNKDNTSTDGNLVFNCVFFGTVEGTNKYPIFGGETIENVYNSGSTTTTGINTYNYFLYDGTTEFTSLNSANAAIEGSYFNRFDLYSGILNSHRDLCAMYIYNTPHITASQLGSIALWQFDPDTKGTIPFLHLDKLTRNTKRISERIVPSTSEEYKGKQLGTVNCTFVINGTTKTLSLPMTDMNKDTWDYTWGKIILPFANEFEGWTLPKTNATNYGSIITGWEITNITGGTPGTWDKSYNLCDPLCTAKDLYSNSNYVWAQGGYYVVPTGVTAITFTAHVARAVYLSDEYPDISYNNTYNTVAYLGSKLPDTYQGKTVYHNLETAYAQLENKPNPADQAIVLVGNYHLNTQLAPDKNVWKTANSNGDVTTVKEKAVTIMSIDADGNQIPDYAFIQANTNQAGRILTSPVRYDFVCSPGLGVTSYTRNGTLPDVAIIHSAGWFEVTETAFMHMTEYEVRPLRFHYSNSPVILNGGIFEKFIQGTNRKNTGTGDKLAYFKFGGKVYITDFAPGHKKEDCDANVKYQARPVNICGGQIDECYMTGNYYNTNSILRGNAFLYCNGGYIKKYMGAYQGRLEGDLTAKIDHALIDEFYGGGNVATYKGGQIGGNISTTINNSYVKFFVAGPKFGDMATEKAVTTVANNTRFGEYYGASYGGTSLVSTFAKNEGIKFSSSSDIVYPHNVNTDYGDKRLQKTNDGIAVSYRREFFIYAGGGTPGNQNGVAELHINYATLSLASTNDVSSIMTNCTFEKDFYGGGCQGKVNGAITNTLTGCTVLGNVYGGGYKASATPIEIYPSEEPGKSMFKGQMGIFTKFVDPTPETYTWVQGNSNNKNTVNSNESNTIYTDVNMSEMGRVTGAITTTFENGSIGHSAFAGGNESHSGSDATIQIQGNATVNGSVYGGGHSASVSEKATVTVKQATVDGSVFGGCDITGNVKNAEVNILGATVTKRVFGGGNGLGNDEGETYGTPSATPSTGSIAQGDDIYNYTDGAYAGQSLPQVLENSMVTIVGLDKEHPALVGQAVGEQENYEQAHAVFGGGQGAGTRVRGNVEVYIGSTDGNLKTTIYGITYGGSYSGFVNSNCSNYTRSKILGYGTNTRVFGDIYGGSYGNYVRGEIDLNINNIQIGINDNHPAGIYAGNNNAAQPECIASINYVGNNCNVSLYGGGNKAPFYGTTRVTFTTGKVGYIFGGGNNANVYGNTIVEILGGEVCHDVYGGGKNGNVEVCPEDNHYGLTSYGGNTTVIVRDDCLQTDATGNWKKDELTGNRYANRGTVPYFWDTQANKGNDPFTAAKQMYILQPNTAGEDGTPKRSEIRIGGSIYGGGLNGTVAGNTDVQIGGK